MTSATLAQALQQWELTVTDTQRELLERYCQQLWTWNERINLTRHDTYDKFVARDLRDAVELAKLLEADEEVLDVGSGGGVPGVLLAILRPDIQVTLCESTGKKAGVLKQIVRELGLPTPVHGERAEKVLEDFRFSAVTARAVGPIAKMLRWFEGHWPSIGRLLLIKGPKWVEERGEARHFGLLANLELRRLSAYPLPGTESESVILGIWPKSSNLSNRY
jgi:16S rRNA (guanine527-N7)-methyltransferase